MYFKQNAIVLEGSLLKSMSQEDYGEQIGTVETYDSEEIEVSEDCVIIQDEGNEENFLWKKRFNSFGGHAIIKTRSTSRLAVCSALNNVLRGMNEGSVAKSEKTKAEIDKLKKRNAELDQMYDRSTQSSHGQ